MNAGAEQEAHGVGVGYEFRHSVLALIVRALHEFTDEDAAFVFRRVNEPSFLRYIGDRGVRTIEDARRYS